MSPSPKMLVDAGTNAQNVKPLTSDAIQAWRWVGWFGLVLTLAGVGDWLLAWIPPRFGSPEWEFGTVAATMSGLPLVTMGFAGLLASAVARAERVQMIVVGVVVVCFALCLLAALMIFLLDVPIALRAVEGPARLGIMKATAKTAFLAVLFSVAYVVAGFGAVRRAGARRRR